jgi:Holliday junction resolvase RusA-like endonuclease
MNLSFRVIGNPRGKGRPRVAIRAGRPVLYTDSKTVKYEDAIASRALFHAKMLGINESFKTVAIDLTVVIQRPKRLRRRKDPNGRIECISSRVDLDNVLKAVIDGLQKSGLIKNDNCVSKIVSRKFYGNKDPLELGCIEVRLSDEMDQVFDNEETLRSLELPCERRK